MVFEEFNERKYRIKDGSVFMKTGEQCFQRLAGNYYTDVYLSAYEG